jgi:Dyp-type peroxidase family
MRAHSTTAYSRRPWSFDETTAPQRGCAAVNLSKLQASSRPPEPLLEVKDIQGNILAGFNKDHQLLLGFRIDDVGKAKKWLNRINVLIANTEEVLAFNALFRMLKKRRSTDPKGLGATWVNIAFSADGLRKLVPGAEVERIPDKAFLNGMLARSASMLHDPSTPGQPGAPDTWEVGGPGRVPDILAIVAGDDPNEVSVAADGLLADAPEVIYQECGRTRPDIPGHEHFGFKDGISQPAVRGLISQNPDIFLEPRIVAEGDPNWDAYSTPGDPLIWPGHFVLGYQVQTRDNGNPVDPQPLPLEWLRNGSFLVFRRLLQDVQAFRQFIQARAASIAAQPGFGWITPELLAAMLVGRWPSGVPIIRSPKTDPGTGQILEDNYFLFESAVEDLHLRAELGARLIKGAPDDTAAATCPFAAHVRKVNPRDEDTDLGDHNDTLTRRILRRGIPFGKPLADPAPANDDGKRGLLFICYQTSIVDQFEVLAQNWANAPDKPKPGGHDPIIGQATEAEERVRRFEISPRPPGPPFVERLTTQFVIPSGGGYFFAPSVSAIRDKLSS